MLGASGVPGVRGGGERGPSPRVCVRRKHRASKLRGSGSFGPGQLGEVDVGAQHFLPRGGTFLCTDDAVGLKKLASRISDLGTLRGVVHAAGLSPHMAAWQEVLLVDLVGTAILIDVLRPLLTAGTAVVCFASIGADLGTIGATPEVLQALDVPLDPSLTARVHEALGASVEDPAAAYSWAKLGVRRLVRREAVGFGRAGARMNLLIRSLRR